MRRLLLLLTLLLGGVVLWYGTAPLRLNLMADAAPAAGPAWRMKKVQAAQVSLTYELDRERWLTFDVPAGTNVLRLISTADLSLASRKDCPTPLPDDVKWVYAIQGQLLDRQGRVLLERDVYQMTRLSEYHDPEVSDTVTPAFYLGEDLIPADSRSLVVRLDEVEGAVKIRLRLKSLEAPLSRVSVRVYHPGETASYKLRYLWKRLPAGRAQKLARGNLFGPELLTEQEKQNLLRQRLTPLAPVGVLGRDYRQHELYVLREIDGEPIREEPLPAGLQVDRDRRALVPLPEEGGKVRLEFRAMKPPPHGVTPAPIKLHWQGKKLTDRESFVLSWDGRRATFEKRLDGGAVEVESADPLVVRAFLPGSEPSGKRLRADPDEITPELIYTWAYLLQGESAVEFPVQPSAEPTPLRVDVRQVWPAGGTGKSLGAVDVAYEMLDANNQVVLRGVLKASEPASLYDRLQQHRQELLVSEPKTSFFAIPPGVVRLRFPPSASAVALSVFNRPAKLAKVCKVPEDYYRFNRDEVAQRSWFLMRAPDHAALELKNRVPLLVLQSRPSDDDPHLLAGVYEWQDHLAGGAWRGRELVVPRDPKAPFRAEALAVTFRELRLDRDETVRFAAEPGRQEVEPTLLLIRDSEEPVTVRVTLDGKLHHQATVLAARGEVTLPPVRVGRRGGDVTVRVTASRPVRVFLNQQDLGDRPAVVKRLAMRLEKEGLTFDYEKVSAEEELLSLFLFRPHGSEGRTALTARIESAKEAGAGPHASWTLRKRRYEVRSSEGKPVPVLGTRKEATDEGQTCFFPVGADLPPGRYRLRVELEGGPGGYVILARTTPGEYEKRAFFMEHPAGGDR